MYVKDERHSDSDPNSRHQQTEQSYLKDHWKPKSESRPQSRRQSETTEPDDPRAKPSQTENSWLQEHHKPKNAEEASAPAQKPSTCTCPKRSKSADPPPVRTHVCMCRSKPQPCGGPSQASRLEKATCSVRTSITGSSGAKTSFKSALTDCTKELFDPCACGKDCPYWARQSNLVPGPSYSRPMDPSTSKGTATSYQSTRTFAPISEAGTTRTGLKPCRSKSLASVPESSRADQRNRSAMTWVSALKDPDSEDWRSQKASEKKICQEPSVSCPPSQANYRSITSRPPFNESSFGVDYETSATTRSQSVVGKITCLCPSEEKLVAPPPADVRSAHKCTCDKDFKDADGSSEGKIQPCTSARIQHPPGFAEYTDGPLRVPKRVSLTPPEGTFCDCRSSSESPCPSCTCCLPRKSDPILTSLHSHRSLSGGSCLCNGDESPPEDLSQSPCVLRDCQCFKDASEDEQGCCCEQGSGFQTPEDVCGIMSMACTRKQRVLRLVEDLSAPSGCECGESRASKIQQLFRELTLLLRSESERAEAPTEEKPCTPPVSFDECCAAQHDGQEEEEERPLSKRELQRVECFHQLEEYLRKCFMPPPEPQVPQSDIYGFEHDPDFAPDVVRERKLPQHSSVQFHDVTDEKASPCTCVTGVEVFKDCEEDGEEGEPAEKPGDEEAGEKVADEKEAGEKKAGDKAPCEKEPCESAVDDLCDKLRSFIDRQLQEIEATVKGKEPEEKTTELILKELCEGSTVMVPSKSEPTKPMPCEKEKGDLIVCPYAGMDECQPWTMPKRELPLFPYSLPFDPCVEKDPSEESSAGEPRGLLPPGPLTPEVRMLCEQLIRRALKECGLCPGTGTGTGTGGSNDTITHSCEEECCVPEGECCMLEEECTQQPDCLPECQEVCFEEECTLTGTQCGLTGVQGELTGAQGELTGAQGELTGAQGDVGCLCCHCRALICDDECKTVTNTLRGAQCDPLCEMKYFIDSMIIDLHAMDCVLGTKQAKPKDIRANDASKNPKESFPVTISNVSSLGCSSLFIQWDVADCRAIAGYEIYVDGHLTNRFYSFRHQAGVVTNVDVTNPHQIVLRAQPVGQEFAGEQPSRPNECGCQAVTPAHPEMEAGAERPWAPSVYYYDPNAAEPGVKC